MTQESYTVETVVIKKFKDNNGLIFNNDSNDLLLFVLFVLFTFQFSTSVVGLGTGRAMNRWLLEEAAQAGGSGALFLLVGSREWRSGSP